MYCVVFTDVWDGFDDCGMGYDPPYVSPEPHPSSVPSYSKDEQVSEYTSHDEDAIKYCSCQK